MAEGRHGCGPRDRPRPGRRPRPARRDARDGAGVEFDRTVAYLKEREQFGAKIGSFQALQHRAARQHVALDMLRGVVMKALRALDEGDHTATALASLAKAVATKTAREILNEAVRSTAASV
ncbi:acyl-CoA dehydrogenase family protein [Sphingomonas sp. MMS24-JH45]